MKIINQTKDTVLAKEVIIADTFLKRVKGLLGRKDFLPGQTLIIKPCNSIHTFFMQFPIDVLFVDKDNRVIKTLSSVKPFRLTSIYFQASFIIELPSGTIQSTLTCKGDTLLLE
jgi:hypothetical protein